MIHRLPALGLAALTALAAPVASAQAAPQAPSQATPPSFRSALEGYQPVSEQEVGPWKELNDTVDRIGGWRAYAREARAGASAPAQAAPAGVPAAPVPKPGAAPAVPHSGHGRQ